MNLHLNFNFPEGGKIGHCNQGNNMYLFPGWVFSPRTDPYACEFGNLYHNVCFRIGLGTLLSGAQIISDGMLQAAAEWYF